MRVDGTWRIHIDVLDVPVGPREGTVRLTSVGKSLSGSWSDGTESLLFDGGRVDDRRLTWSVEAPSAAGTISILFDGLVEDDAISGTVEVGNNGAGGLFRGERISPPA